MISIYTALSSLTHFHRCAYRITYGVVVNSFISYDAVNRLMLYTIQAVIDPH
jgi:hypothetical protein